MMSSRDPVYLDHNATTPVLDEVVEAMLPYLGEHFGNPSSNHVYGQRARQAVDRARAQVASFLGCEPDELYFTSGGTESNNIAICGAAAACERRHLVTSAVEHPATDKPCTRLQMRDWTVSRLDVDSTGRVDLEQAADLIDETTALVTVMHANNEVGTIQPIEELAQLAHQAGALMHTDAAQSLAKIAFSVDDLGVDMLSIAGHKVCAPKGVGALYVRRGTKLKSILHGSSHERGLRPGTENVASIVGLGQACAAAERCADEVTQRLEYLRDGLWARLREAIPGVAVNGDLDNCLVNTLNVRFPDVSGHELLEEARGVAASTGSACHEGTSSPSMVLLSMGIPVQEALGSVRLSLGHQTKKADVQRAAEELIAAWRRLT
jgi:cysteine desulfurase